MTSGCENSNSVTLPTVADTISQIDVVCLDPVNLYYSFPYFEDNISQARNIKDYCGVFDYTLSLMDQTGSSVTIAVFTVDQT